MNYDILQDLARALISSLKDNNELKDKIMDLENTCSVWGSNYENLKTEIETLRKEKNSFELDDKWDSKFNSRLLLNTENNWLKASKDALEGDKDGTED